MRTREENMHFYAFSCFIIIKHEIVIAEPNKDPHFRDWEEREFHKKQTHL